MRAPARSRVADMMCDRCRRLIGVRTRRAMAIAQARGIRIGRPRVEISDRDLARVRAGELTAAELAECMGVSVVTIRRRLRLVGGS